MPPTTTSSSAPHRKAAASPYQKSGKPNTHTRKPSKKTKDTISAQKADNDLAGRNENRNDNGKGNMLVLQAQVPPSPTSTDKTSRKKKKKRKSNGLGEGTGPGEGRPSIEERITAMVEKERKPSKIMEMLDDIRAPPAESPSSSPEPGVDLESQLVAQNDADIEMDSHDHTPNGPLSNIPDEHGNNAIPSSVSTKLPIINKKQKDHIRGKKTKETCLAFLAEYHARNEQEIIQEKEREERQRANKIAQEELEKVRSRTEEVRREAEKVKKEIEELQNRKKQMIEEESKAKLKSEEERRRRTDQELQKVREEKRKYKDLQDKVDNAQNQLDEMKVNYEREKMSRTEKERLVEEGKKQVEESQRKIIDIGTTVKKHENIKNAIIHALECPICLITIDDPHVLSCGHMACRQCLMEWFRSPTALKHEHPEDITPETDLSYRTKLCHVCRSVVLRKPARLFFLRAILEPLGLFQHKDVPPAGSQDVDLWDKLFPVESYTYKLYDPTDDTTRCPECLGEIADSVCQGCNLGFSDQSDLGEDLDLIDGEEESVHGSVLGDGDIIRIDNDNDDGSSTPSSSDSSDVEDGLRRRAGTDTPRSRRNRNAPPPPPPLNNLLNILTAIDDEAEDDDGSYGSSEDEREPNSEDEYGGSFIDDDAEEEEEEDGGGDVSMVDCDEEEESEDEAPRRRIKTRSRRIDPDEDERTENEEDEEEDDQPVFRGSRFRRQRSQVIAISDSE
ncbi:hypothetical protein L486_06193 [Kwoniella mangroviensis CBS 10435]|uniref:RING-type domain-containing protein n=1 Tax=Kwoniella mangroviensis CBS 10435 TaxID=1331196 RepID=A0A1B9IL33_9TREE|nr:hypothetical protein L486_06193 [Kwoniella mangroviensis CBS 10435]